jgi:hypothetical protein
MVAMSALTFGSVGTLVEYSTTVAVICFAGLRRCCQSYQGAFKLSVNDSAGWLSGYRLLCGCSLAEMAVAAVLLLSSVSIESERGQCGTRDVLHRVNLRGLAPDRLVAWLAAFLQLPPPTECVQNSDR